MSETDTRKMIENIGEKIGIMANAMPFQQLKEPLHSLEIDLQTVLTLMISKIERLEEQLEKIQNKEDQSRK